ncbi:hypothetical protein UUU_12700 [Klebsiella pneumoniae subsp. pneumoniae DSM 30104 = JCM 1662 = NBRC 14940]|nr:hypothetical protein UUU_12700 [Klebsiella pneumoniae subsp. pneumoniae DSM 30104 = JCM 1662 = NBRC 14940]
MISTTATWIFMPKASAKLTWKKPLANRLKPCRRFSSTRNTSAAAPILKPGQKRISACLPESIYLLDE